MTQAVLRLFRASLRILPREFRAVYGAEIEDVFTQRLGERSPLARLAFLTEEILDIAVIAARARFDHSAFSQRSIRLAVVTASALTAVVLLNTRNTTGTAHVPSRIDFSAHDAAGQFTLTILKGRPIAVTMNEVPLPPGRVIQSGDSIHVLASSGKVALALAYDRESARIEWKARPVECRSSPTECDASR